ncbi:MAG: YMGG-like glycine zipper-containing protein [Candidatus Methylomirabilales bacterium]
MKRVVLLAIGSLLFTACAGGPMTTREKSTVGGALLGAGTGAAIGAIAGGGRGAATGAAIGAIVGTVGGAVTGDIAQGIEGEQAAAQAAPPPPQPQAVPQTQAAVQVPGTFSGDPTRGELMNATKWRVQVYIDADPGRLPPVPTLALNPQERQAANLDIGQHRIIAQAFVDTQFGPRLVGRYDKTIQIDPKSPGWSIRFSESDFR